MFEDRNMAAIERPNILYIMSDQHAARVMGCTYGANSQLPSLYFLRA